MREDDVRRISEAAIKAAEAEAQATGKPYAVVVIVRELPDAGMLVNVAHNITSGRNDVLRVLKEGTHAVQSSGGGLVI